MSLTRRLRRLLRAHLGTLREDSFDDRPEVSLGDDVEVEAGNATTSGTASSDVPPEVAEAYRALEVPVGSDRETVKKGYRRMMKKYHQDRFQDDDEKRDIAGTVSKRINGAYERVIEHLEDSSS